MAPVPLPDTPCLRIRLSYTQADGFLGGNRFYLKYAGTAPTGSVCDTFATYIAATAWTTFLQQMVNPDWALTEVDVLDIATDSGAFGTWTGSEAGTRTGTAAPAQAAAGVEFDIGRRYRGGKPRIYFPPGNAADMANPSSWASAFTSELGTVTSQFFTSISENGPSSLGAMGHVNLSYYDGYNTSTPPWRGPGFKYPPKYRAVALHDDVSGYAAKTRIASQKRRRGATTA